LSFFIAIVGLLLLILIHEAGHFFASLAVGLRPRRFFVGFPPAIAKYEKNDIEYAVGAIPLGGFVTIPGMHRPVPHDAERRFQRAVEEAPGLAGPYERVKQALASGEFETVGPALDEFEQAAAAKQLSPAAGTSVEKGLDELRDAVGPYAYWKAATWKRFVAIAAGPAANIVLAIVLFTILFMTGSGKATSTVAEVAPTFQNGVTTPASQIGLRAGDRVVAINGERLRPDDIADRIGESEGRPLVVTVVRDGEQLMLGPVQPVETDAGYRLGFGLSGEGLPPHEAVARAFEVTGIITKEIVLAIGELVTPEGREQVSSPIGITQASSDAVERGIENYILILAFISLSLALLNLLPLLPLDGGHLVFILIEGARGRYLKREIYERVSWVGVAFVLLLFFVGLTNDIGRLS
jgi:regulator of sigma E protease